MSFNPKPLMDHIEYLVSQDETELALKCFDMVPAYYRDFKDKTLLALKSEILSKMLMPIELSEDEREYPKTVEHSVNFLRNTARGQLLEQELKAANSKGKAPHIFDYGPGDFTFAIALNHLEYKFKYTPRSLHYRGVEAMKNILGDKMDGQFGGEPVWLVAYEIIEHLADTTEIQQLADRLCLKPEKIFLSTPKYTYSQGTPAWRDEGIHHRRAYTPREFVSASVDMFPDYDLNFVDSDVMCLLGNIKEAHADS